MTIIKIHDEIDKTTIEKIINAHTCSHNEINIFPLAICMSDQEEFTSAWKGFRIAPPKLSALGAGMMAVIGSLLNEVVKSTTKERS